MARAVLDINWRYPGDAIPAFVTLMVMPFTYSIAYGLIAGIFTYIFLNGIPWAVEKVSGGRIKPPGKEEAEGWTWRVEGGLVPGWIRRALQGKKDFWRPYDEVHGVETGKEERESSSGSAEVADLEGVVAGRMKGIEER